MDRPGTGFSNTRRDETCMRRCNKMLILRTAAASQSSLTSPPPACSLPRSDKAHCTRSWRQSSKLLPYPLGLPTVRCDLVVSFPHPVVSQASGPVSAVSQPAAGKVLPVEYRQWSTDKEVLKFLQHALTQVFHTTLIPCFKLPFEGLGFPSGHCSGSRPGALLHLAMPTS